MDIGPPMGKGEELLSKGRSGPLLRAVLLLWALLFLALLIDAAFGWYAGRGPLGIFRPENRPAIWRQIIVLLFFAAMVGMGLQVFWHARAITLDRAEGLLIVRERTLLGLWTGRQVSVGDVTSVLIRDCRGVFRGGGFDVCVRLGDRKWEWLEKEYPWESALSLGRRIAEAIGKPFAGAEGP